MSDLIWFEPSSRKEKKREKREFGGRLQHPAFLARALDALVGAYARPQVLLAPAPDAVMFAYLRSPAFLARALDALVGTYARPQALLALAPDAVMLAYLRSPAFLADVLGSAMLAFLRRHLEQYMLLCYMCFCVVFPFFSVGFQLRCKSIWPCIATPAGSLFDGDMRKQSWEPVDCFFRRCAYPQVSTRILVTSMRRTAKCIVQ